MQLIAEVINTKLLKFCGMVDSISEAKGKAAKNIIGTYKNKSKIKAQAASAGMKPSSPSSSIRPVENALATKRANVPIVPEIII